MSKSRVFAVTLMILSFAACISQKTDPQTDPQAVTDQTNTQEQTVADNTQAMMLDFSDQGYTNISEYYYSKDNQVYIYGEYGSTFDLIEGADLKTFTLLNGYYSKDSKNVFSGTQKIPTADINTFTTFNNIEYAHEYAKDAKHVYFYSEIIKDANPATFVPFGGSQLAKDDKFVYYANSILDRAADPKTFQAGKNNGTYGYDKNAVYYFYADSDSSSWARKEEADAETFEILPGFAKDKNNVYFRDQTLAEADSTSFEIVDNYAGETPIPMYEQVVAQDNNYTYSLINDELKIYERN